MVSASSIHKVSYCYHASQHELLHLCITLCMVMDSTQTPHCVLSHLMPVALFQKPGQHGRNQVKGCHAGLHAGVCLHTILLLAGCQSCHIQGRQADACPCEEGFPLIWKHLRSNESS